mgnify:CR=1 FL=1
MERTLAGFLRQQMTFGGSGNPHHRFLKTFNRLIVLPITCLVYRHDLSVHALILPVNARLKCPIQTRSGKTIRKDPIPARGQGHPCPFTTLFL